MPVADLIQPINGEGVFGIINQIGKSMRFHSPGDILRPVAAKFGGIYNFDTFHSIHRISPGKRQSPVNGLSGKNRQFRDNNICPRYAINIPFGIHRRNFEFIFLIIRKIGKGI